MNTKERDDNFVAKQEGNTSETSKMISRSSTSTASASWTRLKDPRIVRVSRAFGGKDRHSKVCTVRGLRDRRVRLSVPTAIQLYDLQDRLGFNQPSKVVDWLLNAAKHGIDELPPLQIPPGNFPQDLYPVLLQRANKSNDDDGVDHQEENQRNLEDDAYANSSNNLFLMNNNSSSSTLRWDPSNLSLSHHHNQQLAGELIHNFNHVVHMPSSSSSSSGGGGSNHVMHAYFPYCAPAFDGDDNENDARNQSSSSSMIRPFHFSMMANLHQHSNNGNCGAEPTKDGGEFQAR